MNSIQTKNAHRIAKYVKLSEKLFLLYQIHNGKNNWDKSIYVCRILCNLPKALIACN